jgi:divalent metal cation (Fe/Co/Zn/Cd) transporter
VLAVSTVLDLVSIRQSAGQMSARARRYNRDFLDEARVTSDPTLRAVFNEDAVSVSGDVIAFAALALNQVTGSSIPQGIAAVLIGLVLIRISLRLVKRSHDFLVGAWVASASPGHHAADFTQPFRPVDEERARALLLGYPGVTAIGQLLATFVGPGQIWVVARIDIDDGLRADEVKTLVRGIESAMKHESEHFYRVDVVPIGGSQDVRI